MLLWNLFYETLSVDFVEVFFVQMKIWLELMKHEIIYNLSNET